MNRLHNAIFARDCFGISKIDRKFYATRFYLGSAGTPPISPSFDSGWDKTSQSTRIVMHTDKVSTPMTNFTVNEAVTTSPYDVLVAQYISLPLTSQTISGTLKGQIRCLEGDTATDAMYAIVAKVVSADGSTVRGTFLTDYPTSLASEFATGTATNRNFPASVSITSVDAQEGDRIVIEVGVRFHNTTAATKNATLRLGDAASSDLAEDQTTTTDNNPWIEFSANISFSTKLQIASVVSNAQTNLSSATISNVPSHGTNRYLLVLIATFDSTVNGRNVNSVTFNGTSLTQIGENETGSGEHVEAWGLINPANTTGSIVITTVSGNADVISTGAIFFVNSDQSSQPDASFAQTQTSENPMTIDLTTVADNTLIASILNVVTNSGAVPGTGQTQYHSSDSGYIVASYSGHKTPAGSVTHSYSNGGVDTAAMIIVSVKPISGISFTESLTLKYAIKTTPSAKTKSLKYLVKITPTAITNELIYQIKITPSAATKSLRYAVKKTISFTKSLQYAIKSTPAALTKSLQYTIKTIPSAFTKSLQYTIERSITITKSLQYTIKAAFSLTKQLKYTVKTTPSALTKQLKYSILTIPSALTKSLQYSIRTGINIQKQLKYTVKAAVAITKQLKYAIYLGSFSITKSLRYSVKKANAIIKSLRYVVKTSSEITKQLVYEIAGQSAIISKQLKYAIRNPYSVTKSLAYTIKKTPLALTKSLQYTIEKATSITKSLIYTVKTTQSVLQKQLNYLIKRTPVATQKQLHYAIIRPTAIQKSMTYGMRISQTVAITKVLVYKVKGLTPRLSKPLTYHIILGGYVDIYIPQSTIYDERYNSKNTSYTEKYIERVRGRLLTPDGNQILVGGSENEVLIWKEGTVYAEKYP